MNSRNLPMVDFLPKSLWVTLCLPLYRWLTVTKMIHLTSFFLFRSVTAVVLVKFGLASTQKCGWRWKSDPGQGFYRKQLSPLVGNRKLTVSSVDPSFTSRTECEVMTFYANRTFILTQKGRGLLRSAAGLAGAVVFVHSTSSGTRMRCEIQRVAWKMLTPVKC